MIHSLKKKSRFIRCYNLSFWPCRYFLSRWRCLSLCSKYLNVPTLYLNIPMFFCRARLKNNDMYWHIFKSIYSLKQKSERCWDNYLPLSWEGANVELSSILYLSSPYAIFEFLYFYNEQIRFISTAAGIAKIIFVIYSERLRKTRLILDTNNRTSN